MARGGKARSAPYGRDGTDSSSHRVASSVASGRSGDAVSPGRVHVLPVIIPTDSGRPVTKSAIAAAIRAATSPNASRQVSSGRGVSGGRMEYYVADGRPAKSTSKRSTPSSTMRQPQSRRLPQSQSAIASSLGARSRSDTDRSRPRRGRGSSAGRGRDRRHLTESQLNAQLDAYMGEDAHKGRLDNELDSYFQGEDSEKSTAQTGTAASGAADAEAGEIMQ